jgi:hypothetical protein
MKKELYLFAGIAMLLFTTVAFSCSSDTLDDDGDDGIGTNGGDTELPADTFDIALYSDNIADLCAAINSYLSNSPEGTDTEKPVLVKVIGVDLSIEANVIALYAACNKYVNLDLSECLGKQMPCVISAAGQDKIVMITLPISVIAFQQGDWDTIWATRKGVFSGFYNLITANFPGVTWLDIYAFSGCTALKQISAPALLKIEYGAFYGCTKFATGNVSVRSMFPKVFYIGGGETFKDCFLSSRVIEFPCLTMLNGDVFKNSRLGAIKISSALAFDSTAPFAGCSYLRSLYLQCPEDTLPDVQSGGWYSIFGGDFNNHSPLFYGSSETCIYGGKLTIYVPNATMKEKLETAIADTTSRWYWSVQSLGARFHGVEIDTTFLD